MKTKQYFLCVIIFLAISHQAAWAYPADPVLYYQFEDNVNDSSGHGLDGTPSGITYDNSDISGQAAYISDSNYIYVPDTTTTPGGDDSLDFTDAMTFSLWLKVEEFIIDGSSRTFVSKWRYGDWANSSFALTIWEENIGAVLTLDGTSVLSIHTPFTTANIGVWNHLAFTYDNSLLEDNLKLYLNGEVVNSADGIGVITNCSTSMIIGGAHYGGGTLHPECEDAYYDEFLLYNRALTDNEISQLAGNSVPEPVSLILLFTALIKLFMQKK